MKYFYCSFLYDFKNKREALNKEKRILFLNQVIDYIIPQISNIQRKMLLKSSIRIIESYIHTFKVKRKLWKTIIISTIWLTIKAYGIDEEEEYFIDVNYINNFYPDISRENILNFEILIFKHLNYDIISSEKNLFTCYTSNN